MADPMAPNSGSVSVTLENDTLSATGMTHSPLSEANPTFLSIGRIAADWAHFELMLDSTIWILAEVDVDKGSCITGQITSFAGKLQAIVALLKLRKLTDLADVADQLLKESYDVAKARNRVVHDAWFSDPENELIVFQHRSQSAKGDPHGITAVDSDVIKSTIDKIGRRLARARELRRQVRAALLA